MRIVYCDASSDEGFGDAWNRHVVAWVLSDISLEDRVPADHPLRGIRALVDRALKDLDGVLCAMYAKSGRSSVAPGKLIRALLLQVFHSIRSERITRNTTNRESAVPEEVAATTGYAMSQKFMKRIEECFGRGKALRKVKVRGLPKVDWLFKLTMGGYNMI